MTLWHLILLASIAAFALKLSGYLVPASLLDRPAPARVANLTTVALLAALVATQTLASGASIALDARVPAVVLTGLLLALRAPFVVVVVAAAALAAGIRAVF